MHKDKKITLLPLSPADIRKHFKELAANVKNTPTSNESSDAKNNGNKLKEGVYFATSSDAADLYVVPMQPSSLLLGRPWEFDTDVVRHGRTNTYTFMHKNKKITLLPLSPADIRKHFKGIAETVNNTPTSNESSDSKC